MISKQEDKINRLEKLNKLLEKGQAVYIAHKNDRVDQALGYYINNYPEKEKLKIMFLRESEGVYQFGSKKVYVKIEKGDQILCRVGGGFMLIDEFLSQYTDHEYERLDRRDVIARFRNKLEMQKITN